MALEEPFSLRKGDATSRIIGLAAADDERIIVSHRRGIDVHELSARKRAETWPIGSTGSVTSPCVVCSGSNAANETFHAVKDEEVAVTWTRDQRSIDFSEERLGLAVYRLLPVALLSEPTVVFCDGTVALLTDAVRQRSLRKKQSRLDSRVLWTGIDSGGRLYVVQKCLTDVTVAVLILNKKEWECDANVLIEEPENAGALRACCLTSDHLICYYDDGSIWKNFLTEDGSSTSTKVTEIEGGVKGVVLCSINSTCVAVLTAGMSTETILSATLHVVDVKSGTLKNKRNVPMKSFCDDENIELHMTCFPGYIAIAILSELLVFPISISAKSSTLDIVKKCHQTNESPSKPPVTFPNLHSFLSTQNEEKTEQHRDAERRWAQRLATCPDEAQFTALYSEGRLAMNQGKLHEYLDSEARNKRLRKKRRSKATADKMDEALILDPVVAQYVLTQTALRLKEDESFWPRSSLLDMISVSDVSPSLYTVIVKAAVRCKDEDVLKAVLRRDDVDLEEIAIVECLKLALNNDDCKRDELLSLILKKPFNDYTMRSALRNLSFKAALDLLKRFLEVLKPQETEPSLSFLSELEATTWIGLILDAHFAQLMLDPKARDVIVRLHGSVTEKVHVYHQLRRIEGILDYLAKPPKESQQQKSNRLRYSIESMEV